MRDLFQELYNKVLSLFNSSKEEIDPTKNIAVNRLKTVLMQDRAGFSERAIQMLKEELISTVQKYMEIDSENFDLQIDALENGGTVLNLSIPVSRPKTDEEIDFNLKEQELKTQRKAQEIVKELENLIKERTQALIDGKIDPSLIEEATKKVKDEEEKPENKKEKEEQKEQEEKTSKPETEENSSIEPEKEESSLVEPETEENSSIEPEKEDKKPEEKTPEKADKASK